MFDPMPNCKIHSGILPTRPLTFTEGGGGQNVLSLASISTQVIFDALWFQNRATHRQPKTCNRSGDDLPKY